jgi:hypothetical protein
MSTTHELGGFSHKTTQVKLKSGLEEEEEEEV